MQEAPTRETRSSIHIIAQSVAAAEHGDASRIKTEMLERIAVIVSRFGAEAIMRRRQRMESTTVATTQLEILKSLHLQTE